MDYTKLTVVEIRALLKERGIPATGLTRKQQLIERLTEADLNGAGISETDVSTEVASAAALPSATTTTVTNEPERSAVVEKPEVEADGMDAEVVADQTGAEVEAIVNELDAVATMSSQEAEPTVHEPEAVAVSSEPEVEVAVNGQEVDAATNEQEEEAVVIEPSEAEENATMDVMQQEIPEDGASLAEIVPDNAPVIEIFGQPADTSTASTELPNNAPVNETSKEAIETIISIIKTPDEKKMSSPAESPGGEESRKRKRRSLTPAVSSQDVARKRFKDEEAGVVHLNEDLAPKSVENVEPILPVLNETANNASESSQKEDVTMADTIEQQDFEQIRDSQIETLDNARSGGVTASTQGTSLEKMREINPSNEKVRKSAEERPDAAEDRSLSSKSPEISSKDRPPKGQRYNPLFAPPDISTDDPSNIHNDGLNDDRTVAPSLHSATTALYIRDFMRPLHPNTLKDHLAVLAESPSQSTSTDPPDPDKILLDFHLDSIRTHCYAVFNSLAAAARVRSALHERVWPAERDRKPLWVDFIPEEKVRNWIEIEQSTGGRGRGAGSKRWEVIYERSADDGSMNASLQEVGMGGSFSAVPTGPRRSVAAPPPAAPQFPPPEVRRESTQDKTGRGASTAPSRAQPTSTKPQSSSFLALDSLFKSTTAKPKLYFLPVDKERASKRLDELDSRTRKGWDGDVGAAAGGKGAEMTRYTFEDGDVLVDNGPEFGMRNGGRRGRGGGRGGGGPGDEGAGGMGYRGRGGGGGYRGYRGEMRNR